MANLCDIEMRVSAKSDSDFEAFINALEQKGEYAIGRGMTVYNTNREVEGDSVVSLVSGMCKWSAISSFFSDAKSMDRQKKTGKGPWFKGDGFIDSHIILDLSEACEKWDIDLELETREPGMCFSEHMIIEKGVITCNEETDYTETYDEEEDEYISSGGFGILFS